MLIRTLVQQPHYLIRFDDICPTMCWSVWEEMELILRSHDIRPMMGVIPDNQDTSLDQESANPDFWERVRGWQASGWAIGLHGYQHRYVTSSPGIVGLNSYSEFAGLPFEQQYDKLRAALAIFERERVAADVWIAPAHTFDEQTVRALRQLNLTTISDGFHLWPYLDGNGMHWIPQQLGDFYRMAFGVWTVCIHLDDPVHVDVSAFRKKIEKFRKYIVDLPTIQQAYRDSEKSVTNIAVAKLMRWTKQQHRRRYALRTDASGV